MDAKDYYSKHKVAQEKEWLENNRLAPLEGTSRYSKGAIQIVFEMLGRIPLPGSLLDVGCGPLTLLRSLKGKVPNLYGMDITSYSIWTTEPQITTKIVDIDTEAIPFANATFDVVTMLATLEHVFDPFNAVEEVSRVLKNNGYFFVSVPQIAGIKHRISLLFGRLPVTSSPDSFDKRSWDGYHLHYFTLKRLAWLLEKYGYFDVLDVKGSGKFQFLKSFRPSLFSQDLIVACRKVK